MNNSDKILEQLTALVSASRKGGLMGAQGLNRQASSSAFAGIPEDKREAAFTQMLNSGDNGLRRLAYTLTLPLKTKLDYVSVARKLFEVDEVPTGNDFPIYDVDIPEFGAVKISALGEPPQHDIRISRISVPTFLLTIVEPVKYEDVNVRRYKVLDRAKERVAIAVAIAEDDQAFAILEAAALASPNSVITTTLLNKNALAVAMGKITANQLVAATVVMNPVQYSDLLRLGSDVLDQVTLNATIETGMFGTIFGMNLIVSTRCPAGSVYVTTTKDKFGRLAERKKVEVKVFDNVPKAEYDVLGMEQIGIVGYNLNGIVKIVVTGSGTL